MPRIGPSPEYAVVNIERREQCVHSLHLRAQMDAPAFRVDLTRPSSPLSAMQLQDDLVCADVLEPCVRMKSATPLAVLTIHLEQSDASRGVDVLTPRGLIEVGRVQSQEPRQFGRKRRSRAGE